MTKVKEESAKEFEDIGIGDQVKHAKWGVGTVLFRQGTGGTAKVIVVFPEEGQKKLMLKFAKLKKVGSAPKSEVRKAVAKLMPVAPVAPEEAEEVIKAAPAGEIEAEEMDEDIFADDDEKRIAERRETDAPKFDE